ncbi:heavy metal translocating P-type ATPase [Candidatus Venteria ishoeyi]|uniref:heavy metal translocating P-type ATPase n=1 Tax=Candidatus Venteria ishoeyi TaxID=1899563 RepID=UPI0025A5A7F8|nr:heavy metal translocating P-type ATPase [Candidatus Venteria ishoeyi]MDM8546540.1 heavy metal translocating P-type ATPase [Candidatus Venteria ishoeyi]
MSEQTSCYHCGLPVPEHIHLAVHIDGEDRAMCCVGCQAVAEAIVNSGLDDFYRFRTDNAPTGQEVVPEFLRQTQHYDNPDIQRRFVRQLEDEHRREAALILEGITCAACVWLNERHLRSLPGVVEVRVNYSTHRARVVWDEREIQLSQILQAISAIGYLAHPYDPTQAQAILEKERKQQLRRLGFAGLFGMQVMMVSVALYAGDFYGMESSFRQLFHWLNLLLTLPVMGYSAVPFFRSAWRDLSHRQAGMDVPVSLGISLAFLGSLWTTVSGSGGHVYYDSVVMFVFFLLLARYFELMARQRSSQAAESLVQMVPAIATRVLDNGKEEAVPVAELQPGDRVRIVPGDNIPTDGEVITGQSSVDEALLTGESLPRPRGVGDKLSAGTINIESPLLMQVTEVGQDTLLSQILRLLERAQSEKPYITQLADRAAAYFVLAVLVLAAVVALYWWQISPELWLAITLSVLVVTCPCALSLATPTAITAATGTLSGYGLLTTRGHALETLARATHFVFDKTGTLTDGALHLQKVHTPGKRNEAECLQIAAALEQHSEHPLGKALIAAATDFEQRVNLQAQAVVNQPGAGLSGTINGETWFIGTSRFIQAQTTIQISEQQREQLEIDGYALVWLANQQAIQAVFALGDSIRPGSPDLIQDLQQQGIEVLLLTGDHQHSAQRVAQAVGINKVVYDLSPAGKLEEVKALQAQGAVVAMVGDGVNDAPVLAQAQISIAMGSGTQVARATADMILLSEQLPQLIRGVKTAQKTLRIIRQNLSWAVAYNLLALPAAAMGYILPWMAAIGMSASSLLVVANALRLVDKPKKTE